MAKKILKIAYYIFLAAVAVVVLLLIFSAVPVKGNFKSLVVLSSSMEPKVKMGSVVVVHPAAEYKVGDIITFGEISRTKSPTTHRIFEIKSENGEKIYVTKGDANNAPDQQTVRESEIFGKALFSVPYVGYAVAKAKTPVGFLLIVIVPSVVIVYEELKNIAREMKKFWLRRKKKRGHPEGRISNVSFETEEDIPKNIQPIQKSIIKKPRKLYN